MKRIEQTQGVSTSLDAHKGAAMLFAAAFAAVGSLALPAYAETTATTYGFEEVDDVVIFYREAGDPANPTIVMLHGFPSSSHQYRNLLRDLSGDYHVIALDYPGFGASAFPSPDDFPVIRPD